MLQSIQRNVTWRAIPFAGLAAGLAHLLVNLILTPLMLEVSPGLILRYMGSLALGQGVLTQTDGIPVRPFTTTARSKQTLIDALAVAIEQTAIALQPDPVLLAELKSFRLHALPAGIPLCRAIRCP